jgi:hypothetical protein
MQHVAGLASLRALHVVHLRNDDTCVWVMRETKRFLIDNVSHYPDLPLEWIAIDEDHHADRLVRVAAKRKKRDRQRDRKGKNGGGEEATEGTTVNGGAGAKGGGVSGTGKDKKGKGKQTSSSAFNEKLDDMLDSLNLGSSSAAAAAAAAADLDVSSLIATELAAAEAGEMDGDTTSGSDTDDDDDGDDDSGGEDGFLGQKIETLEGIPFCDVVDVRIFKKEVVAGRL